MVDDVMRQAVMARVHVDDAELTTAIWGSGTPEVVFLHDGLGSVAQWRGVPAVVAAQSGRTVLAYDRAGHGTSTPVPTGPWPADWLHREAGVLAALLGELGMREPTLVGHSDGGSIALLHAADVGDSVRGVLALAPHTWVEQVCVDAITSMRESPAIVVAGLARYHAEPSALFEAWSGVWTSEAFRSWDIRDRLGAITAPVLVAQGTNDAYATDAQALETAAAVSATAECRLLDGLGHLLHHDDPDTVAALILDFL